MARTTLFVLLGVLALLALASPARAFGAGNIPSFAFYEGKAFRHGDIEDILCELAKQAGGSFFGMGKGKKFSPLDVKRVYFGNWLRDYSQAIDIASLQKTNVQTIINLLMALGFMAFGYATAEFEITPERVGTYLCTEHIDNPKGYGGNEDPRKYHPQLRPPVDPRELEIDPRSGMKNYIANESGTWDTSTALIKRTIERCIHHARLHRAQGRSEDEYEAYRLLGQLLHTLEDFSAHSNYCELTLINIGYHNVFPHVGNNCKVHAPNGQMVAPLVTGTFGGADFMHSMLGEAGDHLSEASISDLNKAVKKARSDPANTNSGLRSMLFDLPGAPGGDMARDMDDIANSRAADPNQMSPQQLHESLWKVLAFRDKVMKSIENTIDKIPGLGALVEKITNSINVFVFTTIEPYLGPILKSATGGLTNLSDEVINNPEQFEVFTDPMASDPTHSFLSKDHFGLILNEPAGKVAQIVIRHAIEEIVRAWDDISIDPKAVGLKCVEAIHHPSFSSGSSQVQREMQECIRQWIDEQGSQKQAIINRLTMESVRSGDNRRIGDTSTVTHSHDHAGGVPSVGLQGVLGQHNVHVPGAQYLNMGQDLLAGQKPWDPNFGHGQGDGRWRDFDPTAPDQSQQQPHPQFSHQQTQQPTYQQPSYQEPYQQPTYQQQPSYQPPAPQQPSHHSSGGYPGASYQGSHNSGFGGPHGGPPGGHQHDQSQWSGGGGPPGGPPGGWQHGGPPPPHGGGGWGGSPPAPPNQGYQQGGYQSGGGYQGGQQGW